MQTITPQQIQQIVPKTPKLYATAVSGWMNKLAPRGLDTLERRASFLAQWAFETFCFGFTGIQPTEVLSYWNLHNCNALADASNFRAICRAFDKNLSGYGARLLIYKQAMKVLRNQ